MIKSNIVLNKYGKSTINWSINGTVQPRKISISTAMLLCSIKLEDNHSFNKILIKL